MTFHFNDIALMPGIALLMIFEFNLRAGAYIRVGQVGNDNI